MYTLYTFAISSTAWRARIALHLKQIKPNYKFVNLFTNQQKDKQYMKLNPNYGVPTLILPDGRILTQTMPIIQYLNEMHPTPNNLFPGDAYRKAKIRAFCETINCSIHPYQNLRLLQKLEEDYHTDKVKWVIHWNSKGYEVLQKLLKSQNCHGKYTFGDQVTAADIFLFPQIANSISRYNIDINPYPRLKHAFQNLQSVQAFIDSAPNKQPDFA